MARDPFEHAQCRAEGSDPRWWDVDAPTADRDRAASLCADCPAIAACVRAKLEADTAASGTWAGVYYPFVYRRASDDTLAAFTAVFGTSWSDGGSSTPDNPFQLALFEGML